MERRNTRRSGDEEARPVARHRWEGCTTRRFRPSERPVSSDRPREEQTWPTQIEMRSQPQGEGMNDAHPDWPGRKRPAVPCYQRRLDRHTDGMVRSLRIPRERRTVTGRRRGMTTHRRPVAVMGEALHLGRGAEGHYETIYAASSPPVYRRMRVGGALSLGFGEVFGKALAGLAAPSPRGAMVAMIAVLILVVSTVSIGSA